MKRELTVAKTYIGTKDVLTLAHTDVGIAPGSATDVEAKTADLILVKKQS